MTMNAAQSFEVTQSPRMTLISKLFLMAGLFSVFAATLSVVFVPNYKPWAFGFMLASAVSFVLWIVTAFPRVKSYVGKRSTKMGVNSFVLTSIVVAILLGLNFVAHRNEIEKDLTSEGLYSLSEQTLKILKNLNQDIIITTFMVADVEPMVMEALDQFKVYTKKIKVKRVDLVSEPHVAQQYNVKRRNTLIFESMNRESRIDPLNPAKLEEQLTNAIVKVTKEGNKNICFLTGHDELDMEGFEAEGMSELKERLGSSRYVGKVVSLLETETVPSDCAALMIVGPKKALFGGEITALESYINNGGPTGIFLDPYVDKSWAQFVRKWGVEAKDMVIVEYNPIAQAFGGSPVVPTVLKFESNIPFIQDFKGPMAVEMARPILAASKTPDGVTVAPIGFTTDKSWGETSDLRRIRNISFDEGKDLKGPISIGVHVTGPASDAEEADEATKTQAINLVVIGDSNFMNNNLSRHVGNADMALNIVSYFAKDEDLVSIRPKDRNKENLNLSQFDLRLLFGVTIVLLPLMFFFAAGTTYLSRKSK
jgi:ABC-type uncharacterized transport system involved in gliding motility auxiliary subunit